MAALSVSTLATGLTAIAVPVELRQLRATPTETGLALSMWGLGMFLFEWAWGALADRVGYRVPLVASQVLYGLGLLVLSRAHSVFSVALAYLLSSGMMVAAGPLGRSFLGTTLPRGLRATGLAFISAQWVIMSAVGSGAGGQLIDHVSTSAVLSIAAVLPVVSAALMLLVFRGYRESRGLWGAEDEEPPAASPGGESFLRVMVVTAAIVLLAEVGAGGEMALLPLLVINHLGQSPATAGTAMLVVGLFAGVLLVPGGVASDRWGRRRTMVAGGVLSAAGFAAYALAGSFGGVVLGAALRAVGSALVWPAATAWISESAPRKRHALVMGLYGEFENLGITLGPVIGGLAWSAFGIQSAFVTYAALSVGTAGVAAIAVAGTSRRAKIVIEERTDDPQPDRV